jgi:hypothetical protein
MTLWKRIIGKIPFMPALALITAAMSVAALWQAASGVAALSAERSRHNAELAATTGVSRTTLAAVGRSFETSAFDRVWRAPVNSCDRLLIVVLDELSCAVPQARQLAFARTVAERAGSESVLGIVVAKTARFAASWAEANDIPFPVLHVPDRKTLFDMGLPSVPASLLIARSSAPFVVASHMPIAGLEELADPFEQATDNLLTTISCRRP